MKKLWDTVLLPVLGIALLLVLWEVFTRVSDTHLPGPAKTWEASKLYVLEPFTKRGEMDQGILLFAGHSLLLVFQGYGLGLPPRKTFFKILVPATVPYMFTGFRVSLGIAWLAIVAAEMLSGNAGLGSFLWQEYNALVYEHIILCIIVIGLIGFVLDRMMMFAESRFKT